MAPDISGYPLYNATLTLYRQSPLHVAKSTSLLTEASLKAHARRLGDALKGDVLRGVRVALDDRDDGLTRSGLLQECRWKLIRRNAEGAEDDETEAQMNGADGFGTTEGIHIAFEFERCTYTAWMLCAHDTDTSSTPGEFHLPLLALRMPTTLREMFLSYLGTAFDTRADALYIPSTKVGETLEAYLEACANHQEPTLLRIVKDVQLSFAFKAPIAPSLRSLDITIKREDVARFIKEGQRVRNGRSQVTPASAFSGPFLTAVSKHLSAHLAIDFSSKEILLARIACGGFALGREGKVKIFAPALGNDEDGTDSDFAAASREATTCLIRRLLALATTQDLGELG